MSQAPIVSDPHLLLNMRCRQLALDGGSTLDPGNQGPPPPPSLNRVLSAQRQGCHGTPTTHCCLFRARFHEKSRSFFKGKF